MTSELSLSEITKTPVDYNKAYKEWEDEKKRNATSRDKIDKHLEEIVDKVWLDEFKRGTTVIDEFQKYIDGFVKK